MLPLQKQLKKTLVQSTGEVLQELQDIFGENDEAFDKVILLATTFNRIEEANEAGTIPDHEYALQLNKLNQSILKLIDKITEEEALAYELSNAVFQRILVVCKSPEREPFMRNLFPKQYYKNVEYDISVAPRPAASVNQFDLVIFDNFPFEGRDAPYELLRYYLDNTAPYLLYFGEPLNWLYNQPYAEKTYFSSSIFSLHPRIQEMILFLKYTKG